MSKHIYSIMDTQKQHTPGPEGPDAGVRIYEAVYMFTHLLRPVVEYMRKVGWRGTIYIDDLSTLAPTFLECQYWRFWATDLLSQAGWVFSESKWKNPSQKPIFLGFLVDTVCMTFHMP